MFEKIERSSRSLLWIALAVIAISVPYSMGERARDEAKKAEAKALELAKPKPEPRFTLKAHFFNFIGLAWSTRKGFVMFTNTTDSTGYLCLQGAARNRVSGAEIKSLPTCREIKPFESNIDMDFQFAGMDFVTLCPQATDCSMILVTSVDD